MFRRPRYRAKSDPVLLALADAMDDTVTEFERFGGLLERLKDASRRLARISALVRRRGQM